MTKQHSDEMPFLDHLEELRWHILWSLLALVIAVALAFTVLLKIDVIGLLEQPIAPYLPDGKLVFTHPAESFSIVINIAIAFGLVLAFPVILYQLWSFVSPALYKHEKRVVIPLMFFATFLFLCGVSLAYFIALPLAVKWLMGFQTAALTPMITAREYFGFAVSMAIAFGVAFELPIAILGLAALGLVTPQLLNRYRRHALVICVIAGAFLTPGDLLWTTIAMSVPLYLLFEISVALTYVVYRRRERRLRDLTGAGSQGEATA